MITLFLLCNTSYGQGTLWETTSFCSCHDNQPYGVLYTSENSFTSISGQEFSEISYHGEEIQNTNLQLEGTGLPFFKQVFFGDEKSDFFIFANRGQYSHHEQQ